MLSLAEQIFLLSLDETTGHSYPLPEKAMDFALAGATLMGLIETGRLDITLSPLKINQRQLTGDSLLDGVLAELTAHPQKSLEDCLRHVAGNSHLIRQQVCDRLIEKKILTKEEDRFLWVLADERFPIIDHREEREVRQRIREVVLEKKIPSARDIAIISLVDACDLMHTILTEDEMVCSRQRLQTLDVLDPVGRAILQAVAEADHTLIMASHTAI